MWWESLDSTVIFCGMIVSGGCYPTLTVTICALGLRQSVYEGVPELAPSGTGERASNVQGALCTL